MSEVSGERLVGGFLACWLACFLFTRNGFQVEVVGVVVQKNDR